MNMYKNLVNIVFVISRLQRYAFFLKVVSVAYGNNENVKSLKTAKNQKVVKSRTRCPMENFYGWYGKWGATMALLYYRYTPVRDK